MNKLVVGTMVAAAVLLTGCNTTGITKQNAAAIGAVDTQFSHITVYQNRADLPKHTKILGKVTAQNTHMDGTKASSQAIMTELKRQAVLMGGTGIVHVTPGTAQTTADAVIVR